MHDLRELLETVGTDGSLVVDEFVDDGTGLEEVADDLRRRKVVVHGIVALLTQVLDNLLSLSIALRGDLNARKVADGIHQFLETFLCGGKRLIGEVYGAAVVGTQDKEADGHRRIGLLEQRMVTRKELL